MALQVTARLPATDAAAPLARSLVEGLPVEAERRRELRLLVHELVTNAVRHSGATGDDEVAVHMAVSPDLVHVEVEDPARCDSEPHVESLSARDGGLGLFIVQRMACDWGVDRGDHNKVWFDLPRSYSIA